MALEAVKRAVAVYLEAVEVDEAAIAANDGFVSAIAATGEARAKAYANMLSLAFPADGKTKLHAAGIDDVIADAYVAAASRRR